MRLRVLDDTAPPGRTGFVSDIGRALSYRPAFFGAPISELFQQVMRDPASEWSVGERELMAAFVSAQNQCPF